MVNQKVAIFGGSGYLGARACLKLAAKGFDVFQADMRNGEGLARLGPSVTIVNCIGAGMNSDAPVSTGEIRSANVDCAVECAELAERAGARLVHIGSAVETSPAASDDDSYAGTKRRGTEIVGRRMASGDLQGWILRVHLVYGDSDVGIPGRIAASHMRSLPFPLRSPDAVRDLIHIDDVCQAIIAAVESPRCLSEPVEIGTGTGIKLCDLADRIGAITGVEPAWCLSPDVEDASIVVAEVERARELLSFVTSIGLDQGLRTVPSVQFSGRGGVE